jgi:protein SDA1
MRRNDAKTVSIAALGAFHPNTKVQSASLHFFLGSETDDGDESEDSDDEIRQARKSVRAMEHQNQVTKSKRKKERALAQVKKEANKVCLLSLLVGRLLMAETESQGCRLGVHAKLPSARAAA